MIFAAEVCLLTALTGFTVGKRLLGIRVVRLDGRPVGLCWALVRTLLLLVVPPLVTDGDLRGMHDRAANTVVIRIYDQAQRAAGHRQLAAGRPGSAVFGRGALGCRPVLGIGPLGSAATGAAP